MSPHCQVIGVEPARRRRCDAVVPHQALQTVNNPKTVADGARTPSLGSLTFPLVLEHVSDMTTVDDPTLLKTMFYLWERLKLVVEPTGALGRRGRDSKAPRPIRGARVGVILSGGNVDCRRWAELVLDSVRRSTLGGSRSRSSQSGRSSVRPERDAASLLLPHSPSRLHLRRPGQQDSRARSAAPGHLPPDQRRLLDRADRRPAAAWHASPR